jgi:hypothetical protein
MKGLKMNNLFMAIYEEHKQRTGHDIFKQRSFSNLHCNVCLYLNAEKRKAEEEEREYYENN